MSHTNLAKKFPPSRPCTCDICRGYCQRPGWWTVDEAEQAIEAGYAHRMMLEMSPDLTFGVLSPAFKGNEGNFAIQVFARNGCTFLKDGLCEIFGTGFEPLECRYCHHTRRNMGEKCHLVIEKDGHSKEGQQLVIRWGELTGFFERQKIKVNRINYRNKSF